MTGRMNSSTSESKEARPRRSATVKPDSNATLILGLDRLRENLFLRLEQIETLAVEQAELLGQDGSEREQALRERVAVLEAAHTRLQAESKRREQEWQTVLQQLESDRRLLAEAWQRLEEEQLAGPTTSSSTQNQTVATASDRPAVPRAPAARPDDGDPENDPVARAILRQFQALKGDVRRNADGRNGR